MTEKTPWDSIEPPLAGDEVAAMLGSLDRMRGTFAWKCWDLDAESMQTTVGVSAMTMGGLLKHLALVEDHKFSQTLGGHVGDDIWRSGDWDSDPDWEWNSASHDAPEQLYALWLGAVERSRAVMRQVLASGGLDQRVSGVTDEEGRSPNLRRWIMDAIEEYSRHTGHADLIREAIDGRVGEDPPQEQ